MELRSGTISGKKGPEVLPTLFLKGPQHENRMSKC